MTANEKALNEPPPEQARESQPSRLAPHLVRLGEGDWSLWRWMALRGAGFPIKEAFRLAASGCGALADRLIEAEDEAELAWESAQEALGREIDASAGEARAALVKAMKQLKKGRVASNLHELGSAEKPMKDFAAAFDQVENAWNEYNQSFAQSIEAISKEIVDLTRTNMFAKQPSGRTVAHSVPPSSPCREASRMRRRAAQNNANMRSSLPVTCSATAPRMTRSGFSAPSGGPGLTPKRNGSNARYGPQLLKSRNVYYEVWCIEAVIEALAKQEAFRPFFSPRLAPSVHLRGETLFVPFNGPIQLSPKELSALELCDGDRSAKEIAEQLIKAAVFNDPVEARMLLEEMNARNWIIWTPGVPSGSHPEQSLLAMIEQFDEGGPRESASGIFSEIDEARRSVARASGNAEKLDEALGELEAVFTRLTNAEASRLEGQMYAGRTLVYEDCRRDVEVNVGRGIIESLAPPLSLLLTSARWLTCQVADYCRDAFDSIYATLAAKNASTTVNAFEFWVHAERFLNAKSPTLTERFQAALQQKWAEILVIPEGETSVNLSSEELREPVLRSFGTQSPGWSSARYHSPDILIAAKSVEAISRGEYQIVLGELHAAYNTLGWAFFLEQHPRPKELIEAVNLDIPAPRLMPQAPKYWKELTGRGHNILVSPKDISLVFANDSPGMPNTTHLTIGSLVIEKRDQQLIVRSRDNLFSFDIIDAFGEALGGKVIDSFKVFPDNRHRPRVSIDRLVICREAWSFSPDEMEFAFESVEANRFLEARRWARLHGIPRLAYFKSPVEIKPCFIDFDSPIYVNIFSKIIRRTADSSANGERTSPAITMTEMLPGPQELWLLDSEGQTYTSEFRIVAVNNAS